MGRGSGTAVLRGRPRAAGCVTPEVTDGFHTGLDVFATIFNLPNKDSSVLNGLLHPKEAEKFGAILCIMCDPLATVFVWGINMVRVG